MYSVANRLARQGRGGDDTLVHMNRGEVAGLNAINHLVNNRPLSTNPTTGLPEAMDLTDILIGLGIGAAAIFTGGAAAAAAPALLGVEAGGMGALATGAGAGALTGAALNTGKAAIKGDQDLGQAAAFGGISGLLGGVGGAMGVGSEAATGIQGGSEAANESIKEAAKQTLEESAKQGLSETGKEALQASAPSGIAGLSNAPGAASNMTSQAQNAITPSSLQSLSVPTTDVTNATNTGIQSQLGAITPAGAASPTPPGPWEQSFANLQNTVMNPGQHKELLAAQLGAAGLEDQYKQQGLNEQANAKQAAAIVKQYRDAGIMPSELPKQLTDMANQYKGMAAGGTVRDVEGLRSIPTGFVNQQPMTNFYPQSMIPQAQPLQSTQPIRHEVIGYAKGGELQKAKSDYAQLLRGYPNAEKFLSALKHNVSESVPAQEDYTNPEAMASHAMNVALNTARVPEKTVNAYKLFRTKANDPDTLYPLFVNADKPVPMNEWVPAEAGAPAAQNADKVKSLLGPLAYRPGWHAGDVPVATHIGKGGKPPVYRPSEHTWAEVEFPNDVDWQTLANERGMNKKGELVPKFAHITDQIPEGGFYRYKTSPNMTGNWLIGGEMKVNRPITDEEVKAANLASGLGIEDLPRFNEYLSRNMDNPAELSRVINSTAGKDEYYQMLKSAKESELDDMMRMYGQHTSDKAMSDMYKKYNNFLKSGKAEGGIIGYADGGAVGYGYAEGGDVGGGDEGLLHGPGTGQSDGIMGLIDGEQGQELVRLAEGEFVIPADVVSALGDGSTKAGSKVLYDMLNRIRQQAHGHISQANPVNPAQVMPA